MKASWLGGVLALGLTMAALAGGMYWKQRTDGSPKQTSASLIDQDIRRLGRGVDTIVLEGSRQGKTPWGALKGRPRALFFGFTHCAVICPVTVWELNNAVEALGLPPDTLQIQFVTLDPERDTPQTMQKYFEGFDGRVDAYSGRREDIDRIARAFDVSYRKVEEADGQYTIDHTATVFLLDAQGRVVDVLGYGTPPETVQARLRALMESAGAEL
jgi:protein SCO1/2